MGCFLHLKTIYMETQCELGKNFLLQVKQQELDVKKFMLENYKKYHKNGSPRAELWEEIAERLGKDFKPVQGYKLGILRKKILKNKAIRFYDKRNLTNYDMHGLYSKKEYTFESNGSFYVKQLHKVEVYCATEWPKHIKKLISDGKLINLDYCITDINGTHDYRDDHVNWLERVLSSTGLTLEEYLEKNKDRLPADLKEIIDE